METFGVVVQSLEGTELKGDEMIPRLLTLFSLLFLLLDPVSGLAKNDNKRSLKNLDSIGIQMEKGAGCQSCGQRGKPIADDCARNKGLKDCYQPPLQIKCCDAACPKCLGGIAPKPGSSGCLFGCPDGVSCPGTCPCDECACCYTVTKLFTSTSTCLDATTVEFIQEETSSQKIYIVTVTTKTQPITFTVTDIFSFTAITTITSFPTAPSLITTLSVSLSTVSSSIFASTRTLDAVLFTFTDVSTITVTTNPVSTVVDNDNVITSFVSATTLSLTTTVFTGFTFVPDGPIATSTVSGSGTVFNFIYPFDIFSQPTATIGTGIFSTIFINAGTTFFDSLTISTTGTELVATTTRTATVTPTQTEFTTPLAPVPFKMPFFPQ